MELTQVLVRELFDYDDGRLYWRVTNSNRAVAGSTAGSVRPTGYWGVRINGRGHFVHRVVFLWHYGYSPEVVDHIDGNPENNRIENLRASTPRLNQGNRRGSRELPKGVDYKPRTGRYQARITVCGRQVYLGMYNTPEAAHAAYMEAARKHFGEFARAA